jgi:hypothetical protein
LHLASRAAVDQALLRLTRQVDLRLRRRIEVADSLALERPPADCVTRVRGCRSVDVLIDEQAHLGLGFVDV